MEMDFKFRIYLFNNSAMKVLSGLVCMITLTFWRPDWDYHHFMRCVKRDLERKIKNGR